MKYTALFPLLFLVACAADRKDYVIEFDHVDRLTSGSPVILNGLEIGKVTNIKLGVSNEVLVAVQIDNDVSISSDSKFIIVTDFLGNRSIRIEPGTNREHIVPGSHVAGARAKTEKDTLSNPITRVITGIFDSRSTKQDSILIELRRLNDNLEKLMNSQ